MTIDSRATHLNERIIRLPTRSLEILLGLKHDLVSARLKRAGLRQIIRDEVQTPSVRVRYGGSDSEPLSCTDWVGLQDAGSEELDLDTLGRFADG